MVSNFVVTVNGLDPMGRRETEGRERDSGKSKDGEGERGRLGGLGEEVHGLKLLRRELAGGMKDCEVVVIGRQMKQR